MKKLIPMVDFVLGQEQPTYLQKEEFEGVYYKIHNYANFLKQTLKLEIFVPCDDNGNSIYFEYSKNPIALDDRDYCDALEIYEKAKEKVLFEGFEYDQHGFAYLTTQKGCGFDEEYMENKTIEDLIPYNLTLTESAIKQIYK